MSLSFFEVRQKIWAGLAGLIAFTILYMVPNHFNFFPVVYLPSFSFEKDIPYLSWTLWIYLSDYLYVILVFVLLADKENVNRTYFSMLFLLLASSIIFLFVPTVYPRPAVEYLGLNGFFLKLLHSMDSPGNAFPSLHVAMTFLAGYGFLKEKRYLFPWFMIWAVLISLSTLTVKQHYLLDVIAGFIMSVIFYYFGQKCIREVGKECTTG